MSDRPCTCHPDDNPPRPCPQKYALSECRKVDDEIERLQLEFATCEVDRDRYAREANKLEARLAEAESSRDRFMAVVEAQTFELSTKAMQLARYLKAFQHTHEADWSGNRLTDRCRKCGLDLRDPVHARAAGSAPAAPLCPYCGMPDCGYTGGECVAETVSEVQK